MRLSWVIMIHELTPILPLNTTLNVLVVNQCLSRDNLFGYGKFFSRSGCLNRSQSCCALFSRTHFCGRNGRLDWNSFDVH